MEMIYTQFGKPNWKTFEQGIEKEWLLTNGIGGFASSTIIGANTRRYHGLLVASLKSPVSRHLILSKLDESISLEGESYNLYSYQTPDFIMKGYSNLQRVVIDPIPTFIYNVADIFIEKKVCMVYGENTTSIVYHVINGSSNAKLRLTPLVNFRDYHHNSSREYMRFEQKEDTKSIILKPTYSDLNIKIFCSDGVFISQSDCYFMNMDYAMERERGLQSTEDHYIPGYFDILLKPGEDRYITVIATIENELPDTDGNSLIKREEERLDKLLKTAGYKDKLAQKLVLAADQFIVHRKSTDAKTIIAGYPWFTDWGRDTMIAFTGVTLTTGRYADAKEILYTFSRYVKDGLLPNMFPEEGQIPGYNSVDAALWYFEAVNKYIEYTGDYNFIEENIYSALKEIINAYINGTHFKIKMDNDFLISAGEGDTQLTWMDAKVGDWVVTPRHGKAVEINALWYNALRVMGKLEKQYNGNETKYNSLAEKVKSSFTESFWNDDKKCLFDVITSSYKDGRVRPNQIIAASLSYPVLEGELAMKIVRKVWKELYTAYGLRTLSKEEGEYIGIYIGDQYHRDGSYHQGTVWTWPLGQFITAFLKADGYTEKGKKIALKFIEPFRDHLRDACIGSISEIFDGDEPLIARGCFAQAWSVGEILRAYIEDVCKVKE